jgi:hypothetical protein
MDKNLQLLIDTYTVQAMSWDTYADAAEENTPPEGWSPEILEAVAQWRHRASTCRYLAEEVRAGLN